MKKIACGMGALNAKIETNAFITSAHECFEAPSVTRSRLQAVITSRRTRAPNLVPSATRVRDTTEPRPSPAQKTRERCRLKVDSRNNRVGGIGHRQPNRLV